MPDPAKPATDFDPVTWVREHWALIGGIVLVLLVLWVASRPTRRGSNSTSHASATSAANPTAPRNDGVRKTGRRSRPPSFTRASISSEGEKGMVAPGLEPGTSCM